jgi:hypothetical protein
MHKAERTSSWIMQGSTAHRTEQAQAGLVHMCRLYTEDVVVESELHGNDEQQCLLAATAALHLLAP